MSMGFCTYLLHANTFSERAESGQLMALSTELKKKYGIQSVIAYYKNSPANNEKRIAEARRSGLELYPYSSGTELRKFASRQNVDLSFVTTDGSVRGVQYCREEPKRYRLGDSVHVNHVVFRHFSPHGDFYLYVSDWLFNWSKSRRFLTPRLSGSKDVFVASLPHGMSNKHDLNFDLRKRVGIPQEGFVIGRIGGYENYDDSAAQCAILKILRAHPHVYFLAVNTRNFGDHPQIIYLDYLDREDISEFYQACDLLINGRLMGESFGFSIAEPLAHGKPILAPHWLRNPQMDRNHIQMLSGLGLLYKSEGDLTRRIQAFISGRQISAFELQSRVSSFSVSRMAAQLFQIQKIHSQSNKSELMMLDGYFAKSVI